MVHKLIAWSLDNALLVLAAGVALIGIGGHAFLNVNVEAYPDPAPAIVEVIAKYPGASAEEVERQVTIPLEVVLAGMPGLKYTRSKSLFGLSHLRNQFDYGIDFYRARQEVINRLQFVEGLPDGVDPAISPQSPTGEILRYTLKNPKDPLGNDVYSLNDLKSVQDWVLERQFRRVPRIIDVVSGGGTVKRYEVHPDPERLVRYGITLDQLQKAISDSNANVGGDYLVFGENVLNVRGIGLIGEGLDPTRAPEVLMARDPRSAADFLRSEEARRLLRIRRTVITAVNNVPVRVEDVVDGGPLKYHDDLGQQGVVVNHLPRLGKVSLSQPKQDSAGHDLVDQDGNVVWIDEPEKVQGIVLLRKGEASLPALDDLDVRINELNTNAGQMLPGVKIEPYYDRTHLIHMTTETVHENLAVGMILVTLIYLLMFLSNIRCALIVAINIPLALLFAFAALYLRGKSANLLSIGAVDFGIIVDSSVIMVENIYRHLTTEDQFALPLKERILSATGEVERGLFYTTLIMVCAFLPLFTMQGPEGQIFGPMADTYAFALGGALLLALTMAPVLCSLFFKDIKARPDNFLVRWLKYRYLRQLEICLNYRWITLGVIVGMIVATMIALPSLGREFMPELEEGNLWVRGTFPINIAQEEATRQGDIARSILRRFPEVEVVVGQNGRPDDGTDPTGFYNMELFVPLRQHAEWPRVVKHTGWRVLFGAMRQRTKAELINDMDVQLSENIVGVDWNFSQNIRDNVMESLSGVKGDNSVKIFGPDLEELERLALQLTTELQAIPGIQNVGIFRVRGQPNLEIPVDVEKCNRWGVTVANVEDVIQTAVGGKPVSTMIEGEKRFDISLRWPAALRGSEASIMNIPVDVSNNRTVDDDSQSKGKSSGGGPSLAGAHMPSPALAGSKQSGAINVGDAAPRRRLGDLITPLNDQGLPDPNGKFIRAGASTIYREQGNRMIAVKFSVRGRDLAGAVSEAQEKTKHLIHPPYSTVWSGEFDQMRQAEQRLMWIVPISMTFIFLLIYLAFHSLLDTLAVFANVAELSVGGFWALYFTGLNFSVSAAVGFISIFGVAVMDGILLISYFNQLRLQGLPLREAIMVGAERRVRPVMMTALTAILGLLPAAVSTRIGAQTQQPLAIVVVGGMALTLVVTRYLMPVLYSFYGHREPPASSGKMAH